VPADGAELPVPDSEPSHVAGDVRTILQLGSVAQQVVRKAPCQVLTVEVPPLDTQAFDERLWTFTRAWLLERIKNPVQS